MSAKVKDLLIGNDAIEPVVNRRSFMKGGASASAAFAALAARRASGAELLPNLGSYGPVAPVADEATGLELLALPEGFRYISYGWTGQLQNDGTPTPTDHDGMAVVGRRGPVVALVRNYEQSADEGNKAEPSGAVYNPNEWGGTGNLYFDTLRGEFLGSFTSLGGTIRNCAGGPTPWGSWVTCEETFQDWNTRPDGFNHGYCFEVPGFSKGNPEPIRGAGRFSHEAIGIDTATGFMYQTEDANPGGFYRFEPSEYGNLFSEGPLGALAVVGEPGKDMRGGFADGTTFQCEFVPVTDVEAVNGRCFDSAAGAAVFSRLEGCWEDGGLIWFTSTDGGAASLGQVYSFNPRTSTLTMEYESRNSADVDGPDNIAISPRGGVILCEDGGSNPKRLIALAPNGATETFAENRVTLAPGDIDIIDAVYPGTKEFFSDSPEGSFTSREWAGACFFGRWLFVNIQSPGITFAITGPWRRGAL